MNAIMQMEQPKNQNFYQNLFEQFSELHVFFKQSKKVQETISPEI
jgi:hemoglobin-like flavoprotein